MILRHQLPAWSPLTARVLSAGLFPASDALSRIERRITSEYRARSVVLTSSGTVALALSFLAAVPPGQSRPRVGLPAWGCYDLMTAADAAEAEVHLYDLDPSTLAPETHSFAQALQRELHAVTVVHWYGVPVETSSLATMVHSAGALLIDDAAQAVGASIAGRPAGAGGDFGVLSFGRGKGRTGGSGGALLAITGEAETRLRQVTSRLKGPSRAIGSYAALWGQWLLGRPGLYGLPASTPGLRLGETIYRQPPELRSMATRSAAVLEAGWELARAEAEARRLNATRWHEIVKANSVASIVPPSDAVPGWLRFPALVSQERGHWLMEREADRHGVARGYPLPLWKLPVKVGRIAMKDSQCAGAQVLSEQLFTLPTHSRVSEVEFRAIERLLAS